MQCKKILCQQNNGTYKNIRMETFFYQDSVLRSFIDIVLFIKRLKAVKLGTYAKINLAFFAHNIGFSMAVATFCNYFFFFFNTWICPMPYFCTESKE